MRFFCLVSLLALNACSYETSVITRPVDTDQTTETSPDTDAGSTTTDTDASDTGWDPCSTTERRLVDADGDGYGDPNNYIQIGVCEPWTSGYVNWIEGRDDCDDANSAVHPDADEVCDWVADNNCDGTPDVRELDGSYDANGDGDFDDYELGEFSEYGGPDGFTVCYPYYTQIDADGDGYCATGLDANGDGDCLDISSGDVLYANDGTCPDMYQDCDVVSPDIYPGHGC